MHRGKVQLTSEQQHLTPGIALAPTTWQAVYTAAVLQKVVLHRKEVHAASTHHNRPWSESQQPSIWTRETADLDMYHPAECTMHDVQIIGKFHIDMLPGLCNVTEALYTA